MPLQNSRGQHTAAIVKEDGGMGGVIEGSRLLNGENGWSVGKVWKSGVPSRDSTLPVSRGILPQASLREASDSDRPYVLRIGYMCILRYLKKGKYRAN